MEKTMTKEQAYQVINNAIAGIQTTRQNHELLILALKILYPVVINKEKESSNT